jgi:hypothetical protein
MVKLVETGAIVTTPLCTVAVPVAGAIWVQVWLEPLLTSTSKIQLERLDPVEVSRLNPEIFGVVENVAVAALRVPTGKLEALSVAEVIST